MIVVIFLVFVIFLVVISVLVVVFIFFVLVLCCCFRYGNPQSDHPNFTTEYPALPDTGVANLLSPKPTGHAILFGYSLCISRRDAVVIVAKVGPFLILGHVGGSRSLAVDARGFRVAAAIFLLLLLMLLLRLSADAALQRIFILAVGRRRCRSGRAGGRRRRRHHRLIECEYRAIMPVRLNGRRKLQRKS